MSLKSGAKLFSFHSRIPQAVTQPTGGSTRLSCFPQMPAAFPAAAKRKFSSASVPRRAAAAETAFRVGSFNRVVSHMYRGLTGKRHQGACGRVAEGKVQITSFLNSKHQVHHTAHGWEKLWVWGFFSLAPS